MAVISVRADTAGRDGSLDSSLLRDYKMTFTVETDLATDGSEIVLAAVGIPRLYDFYIPASGEAGLNSQCHNVRADQITGSRTMWRVVAYFSNRLPRPDLNAFTDPLIRPAEVSMDTVNVAIVATTDLFRTAITNSAGDYFDPPPETEEARLVIRITQNVSLDDFDMPLYRSNVDHLNSEPFLGFKPRQVKLKRVSATEKYEGIYFWVVTFEFEVKESRIPSGAILPTQSGQEETAVNSLAWTTWLLDRGYRELLASDPTKCVTMMNLDNLTFPSQPPLLDGEGFRLQGGEDPVYLGYDLLQAINFGALNLRIL